jgi:hypothetical protein
MKSTNAVFFFLLVGVEFWKKMEGAQGIKGLLMEKMGTSCHIMVK